MLKSDKKFKQELEQQLAGLITIVIVAIFISWSFCGYSHKKLQRELNFNTSTIIKYEVKHTYNTWIKKIPSKYSVKNRLKLIAIQECKKRELDNYCIDDLMAMAWVESRFNNKAIGDNGKSHGLFQIHLGYHKHITQEQAQDANFAIKWTLNRLIAKGYPKYRTNAIRLHNGSLNNPKTLQYFNKVNNYISKS